MCFLFKDRQKHLEVGLYRLPVNIYVTIIIYVINMS